MTIGNETYESVKRVPISEGIKTLMLFGELINMFFGNEGDLDGKRPAKHEGDTKFRDHIWRRLKNDAS